jgi:hypothetical protein
MFHHAFSFTGINGLWSWQTINLQDTSEMFLGAISFQGTGLPSWTISSLLSSRLMVSLECKYGHFFVWYLF